MADISAFQDVTFYVEVAENTNTTIKLQTAPVKEETYFAAANLVSSAPAVGVTVTKILWSNAAQPPARWIRWHATNTGAGAWNITFRITMNLNPGGSILTSGNGAIARAAANGTGMASGPPGMMRR